MGGILRRIRNYFNFNYLRDCRFGVTLEFDLHFYSAGRWPPWGLAEGAFFMNCRDTIHLICWYLEGKLSPSVSSDIEQHLGTCQDCRIVLSAATTTLDQYFATLTDAQSPASTQAA